MYPAVLYPPPAPYPRRRGAISLRGGHPSNGASKKQGTKSVDGGIRGRAYYFRRCKKVPASNIESLPNEVLIEILVRLSVEEIIENARLVCRHWYRIIHSDAFVNAHLHHHRDNWGLLLTCSNRHEHPMFVCVRHGRIEVSKLYRKGLIPVPASCNGLGLAIFKLYTFRFVNLATRQAFRSPPSRPPGKAFYCNFGMAYAAASMEYKVVRAYTPDLEQTQTLCDILTAGVDNNWRSVGVDHLSCGAKKLLLLKSPLTTQGFMHWTWKWEGTRILSLNAETEMFTESYVPILPHPVDDDDDDDDVVDDNGKCKFFVSTGRRLCLFSGCGDWVWEVWEMDEGGSGEWIKVLPNIDLEAHNRRVKQVLPSNHTFGFLKPLSWVKYPLLLALDYGITCFVYNLATGEIDYSFKLGCPCYQYRALVHRNTLEWLS